MELRDADTGRYLERNVGSAAGELVGVERHLALCSRMAGGWGKPANRWCVFAELSHSLFLPSGPTEFILRDSLCS